jgi:hypothetical protein
VSKRHPQEWIAAAVLTVVLALIALDVVDHAFSTWFDRHSFATDAVSTLLGLAVAALVVDRISARRSLRDRAQVMAAQGAMIAAQALRATQAVTSALDGSGDRDSAADELRTRQCSWTRRTRVSSWRGASIWRPSSPGRWA